MADQSDVMDGLEALCLAASYPAGAAGPSVTGSPVDVGQGWPLPEDVDAAMRAGRTLVGIYLVPGGSTDMPVLDYDPQPLGPIVHGVAAVIDEDGLVTFSGVAKAREYVTVLANGQAYSRASPQPETPEAVAAAMRAKLLPDHPDAVARGRTLLIPSARSLAVRVGTPTLQASVIHRQQEHFRLIVFSPFPAHRSAVARALDVAVKATLRIAMPDGSKSILAYSGSFLSDHDMKAGIYRRDVMLSAWYDTLLVEEAFEVTAVEVSGTVAVTA